MNDSDKISNLNCKLGMKVNVGGPTFLLYSRSIFYIGNICYITPILRLSGMQDKSVHL